MTWFKVCDTANMHQKIVMASGDAVKMWVRCGSWSAQQLTDGFIPDAFVPSLGSFEHADELVTVGLWEREESPAKGYRFHDWLHYQPSKAQIEKRRAEDRRRQSAWRERHGVTRAVTHAVPGSGEEQGSAPPPLSRVPRESRRDTRQNPPEVSEKCGHESTDFSCPICRRYLKDSA